MESSSHKIKTGKKPLVMAVIASNVSLLTAMAYGLMSMRVSIYYLDKEGFGLVCLIGQLIAQLAILDLGVFVAFSRVLVDYVDDEDDYAKAICTAKVIFTTLGSLCFLIGIGLAVFGHSMFNIPPRYALSFSILILGQSIIMFISFAIKHYTAPLVVYNRQDVYPWLNSIGFLINLGVTWVCFSIGLGVYSILIGIAIQTLFTNVNVYRIAKCYQPKSLSGVKYDKSIGLEIVKFAKDTGIWQIGGVIIRTLPTFLISVFYGLLLVSDIAGGMKLIILLISIITRLPEVAVAPFAHLITKNKHIEVRQQYLKISEITAALGIAATVFIVVCNRSFLEWWMYGELAWSRSDNLFAALRIFPLMLFRSFHSYAVATKDINTLKWSPFVEALVLFVGYSLLHGSLGPMVILYLFPITSFISGLWVASVLARRGDFKVREMLHFNLKQVAVFCLAVMTSLYLTELVSLELVLNYVSSDYGDMVHFFCLAILAVIVAGAFFVLALSKESVAYMLGMVKKKLGGEKF